MRKLYWMLRAAMRMREICGFWKPKDLMFCWETAATIYDNYEYDGRLSEIGDPVEEIEEELSCWSD